MWVTELCITVGDTDHGAAVQWPHRSRLPGYQEELGEGHSC